MNLEREGPRGIFDVFAVEVLASKQASKKRITCSTSRTHCTCTYLISNLRSSRRPRIDAENAARSFLYVQQLLTATSKGTPGQAPLLKTIVAVT